jgi:hypothetical protein
LLHLVKLLSLMLVEPALPVLRKPFLAFTFSESGTNASFTLSVSFMSCDST